jgi:DNA uptake protein ComE-like DNA-binding protein
MTVRSASLRTTLIVTLLLIALHSAAAQATPAPAPQQSIAQKIAASQSLLDINTATPAELKSLPGMGDAYVQRVIAARPYTAKNQLTTRGILPAAEYERIRDLIIAHRPKPQ